MGDWTPSSPVLLPTELRQCQAGAAVLSSAKQAIAERVKPGNVTVARAHLYVASKVGNPLVGVELVSTLDPAGPTDTTVYPAADVSIGSWLNSAGTGVNLFSYVDDAYGTADYAKLVAPATNQWLWMRGAGAAVGLNRVTAVTVSCYARAVSGVGTSVRVTPGLNLSGTAYAGGETVVGSSWQTVSSSWTANPATGKPWTVSEVEAFSRAAGADEFGVYGSTATVSLDEVQVASVWLTITTYADNRVCWGHGLTVVPGWNELTFSTTAVASASTWYYLTVFPTAIASGESLTIPYVYPVSVVEAASGSASTGEHRKVWPYLVSRAGSTSTETATTPIAGGTLGLLLDTGSIIATSTPFVEVDTITVSNGVPAAQLGQEITTSASAGISYAGVRVPVRWEGTLRPDAPLLLKFRTTSFGGTVQATATLNPADLDYSAGFADAYVPFDASYTPAASSKFFLTIESAATAGRGWVIPMLDSRSDLLTGTTSAEVEGAGYTGTTDAASPASSTRNTRYDLPVAILQAPTAPASFVATPATAA